METQSYSLDWLLDLSQKGGLINGDVRRDIEVRAPQQRARIQRQGAEHGLGKNGGPTSHYFVSPAELVASFGLTDATGSDLDEDRLTGMVARAAGLPYHKIDPLKLDMRLITATLSRPFALRHVALPIARADGRLKVAVDNPFDAELVESLRRITQCDIDVVVASKRDILKAIVEIYGFRRSVESAARESHAGELADFEQLVRLRPVGEIEGTDQHVVNAVDFLLRYAFDQRASDIHIESRRGDSQVRLRIDGVLHNVQTFPRRVHAAIVSRIKTVARIDIAEKRRPQDGRIKTAFGDREVELRVSTLPTAFGEKIVIRIFDPEILLRDFADLGFDPQDQRTFERWVARPNGLILITGPTGSGKTTTLYTTLKTLADDSVNVTSIEDPIEMITDRFNQVQVQPKIDVDFAGALRHILRQDPDIIMVGEIRDGETAQMAVQAALTGHLVFSTLHTNDAVGAVTRLVELGVPPFLVTSTVVGVMAQRLVRTICRKCVQPASITADQRLALGIEHSDDYQNTATGVGCVACRGTGYRGRIGVFELLEFDRDLAAMVLAGTAENDLRAHARRQGLRSLRDCALARFKEAKTSFEEVVRVIGPAWNA